MQDVAMGADPSDDQALRQLVDSNDLETLLSYANLNFELRCRTEVLIEYLQQKTTLRRLLDMIFTEQNSDKAAQAVQLLHSCENMHEIMVVIVEDQGLLSTPFIALQALADELDSMGIPDPQRACAPIVFPPQVIPRATQLLVGFSQAIKSIMWTAKRFHIVLSFLLLHSHYLSLWVRFIENAQMADTFRFLFYDNNPRDQTSQELVEKLVTATDVLGLLLNNIVRPNVPHGYMASAVDILCKIMVRNIPGASQRVLNGVSGVVTHIFYHQFDGAEQQWCLQPLGDLVLCAMSYMSVQILKIYRAVPVETLAAVPADIRDKRAGEVQELLGVAIDQDTVISSIPDHCHILPMDGTELALTPLGIAEIDSYEQQIYRLYFHILSLFNYLPVQLERLQSNNGSKVSLGSIMLLRLVARLLATGADVRNSLVTDTPAMISTTNNIIMTSPYAYSADTFSRLPEIGIYTSSGNYKVTCEEVVLCGGIPVYVGALSVVRKFVALHLHEMAVSCLSKFPSNSTVHFLALQIIQSMLQYGSSIPDATLTVVRNQAIKFRFESASYGAVLRYKERTSGLTHLIQLARYILRVCFRIADQVEQRQKLRYLQPSSLRTLPQDNDWKSATAWKYKTYPTSLRSALQLASELGKDNAGSALVYTELLDILQIMTGFVRFSEIFLEQNEKTPNTFFDGCCRHTHGASDTDSILGDA